MASLHKQSGKPNWFCAFTSPDGTRHFKSTGTHDRKQAEQICRTWAKASLYGEKLNADKAREIIAAGVADVMAATGQTLPSTSISNWIGRWLNTKSVENEPATHTRYEAAMRTFSDFFGRQADRNLEFLNADKILAFRDYCAAKASVGTTNTNLKIVRSCLNAALHQGLMGSNPAIQVKLLKERGQSKRREMTLAEIQTVLKQCGDTNWRGLVLTGLYAGQRIGDCARLTWQQVDLAKKTISFVTQKTGKRLSMRMAEPLADYFSELPASDNPAAFVFPQLAALGEKSSAPLSKAFAEEILIPAGLMASRKTNHAANGTGRKGQRQVNEITFHSLRHSLVTMLKATGASQAMAQMIVGHDSTAVSKRYTHLSADDTADAIGKLPDVTRRA